MFLNKQLQCSSIISTATADVEINLDDENKKLVALKKIKAATKTRNDFIKELGLSVLS